MSLAARSALPPKPTEPPRAAKLTYKDARRLEELDRLMPRLQAEIVDLGKALEDPGLYLRDPAAFERTSGALEAARVRLASAEEEWLQLEEKREEMAKLV